MPWVAMYSRNTLDDPSLKETVTVVTRVFVARAETAVNTAAVSMRIAA